ncbi:MAG: hypothetical protein Q8Q18_03075 [bacterium]|nr:hypothetical protein [bacterium]
MNFLRAITAIGLGYLLTLFFSCAVIVLWPFGLHTNVLVVWANTVCALCVQRILGIRTELNIPPLPEASLIVVFGNHPSSICLAPYAWFIRRVLNRQMCAVSKDTMPFVIQKAMNLTGWAIPISRDSNSTKAKQTIAERVRLLKDNVHRALIIFPDSRRPTKARIKESREYYASRIEHLSEWLKYTLVPKSGGLHAIISGLPEKTIYIDVTVACNRNDSVLETSNFYTNISSLIGGVIYFTGEIVEPPRDEHELRLWLIERWKKKNIFIDSLRP